MNVETVQSRPLFAGRYLRWAEIRDDSHSFVNVQIDPSKPAMTRREWCNFPWTDEQILDPRFGELRPLGFAA